MGEVAQLNRAPWRDGLQMNGNGGIRATLRNACIMLREAPEFRGRIAYDEFAMRTVVVAPLPWSDGDEPTRTDPRPWDGHDDLAATEWAQAQDLQVKREIVQQAVEAVAYEARFHPVRAYLNGLKWDGTKRLSKWLTYYLGVEPSRYAVAVGRCALIAAVARIFEPGCKADHVLILEGDQDLGKSTAIRVLVGDAWFTDELADFGSKDAALQMRGKWVIELGELDQLSRAEAGRAKAWISRQVDRFRPPYGVRLVDAPRECVFIGTTNIYTYLKDESGNRRYWPVRCLSVDLPSLRNDRDQLWAEAVQAYRDGEKWWITDAAVKAEAKSQQTARDEEDAWADAIRDWFDRDAIAFVGGFSTKEVLDKALFLKAGDMHTGHARRVAKILRRMGFEQKSTRRGGGDGHRVWVRSPDQPEGEP